MKRRAAGALALLALLAAALVYAMQPFCTPIDDADHEGFHPPIEQRDDMDFQVRVFQRRDGRWLQCKTRLSRAFFF